MHLPTAGWQVVVSAIVWLMRGTTTRAQFIGGESLTNIVDTSHASWLAAGFFQGYFAAKTYHDPSWWLNFFHPVQAVYYDAVLGVGMPSRAAVETTLTQLAQSWPEGAASYPVRILGNTISAVVFMVDTPEMFGAELRAVAAIDFKDGKVTRQVDYWNGRNSPVIGNAGGRVSESEYPYELGVQTIGENAAIHMKNVCHELSAMLAMGNVTGALLKLTDDVIFEDSTLQIRLEGKIAINGYFERALPSLPYGIGAKLRHVLGSNQGGGFEWIGGNDLVKNGITGLELDNNGFVTRMTSVWDASILSPEAVRQVALLAIDE